MPTLRTCAVDGVLYKAVPELGKNTLCDGCAGEDKEWECLPDSLCAKLDACAAPHIIWIKVEAE